MRAKREEDRHVLILFVDTDCYPVDPCAETWSDGADTHIQCAVFPLLPNPTTRHGSAYQCCQGRSSCPGKTTHTWRKQDRCICTDMPCQNIVYATTNPCLSFNTTWPGVFITIQQNWSFRANQRSQKQSRRCRVKLFLRLS